MPESIRCTNPGCKGATPVGRTSAIHVRVYQLVRRGTVLAAVASVADIPAILEWVESPYRRYRVPYDLFDTALLPDGDGAYIIASSRARGVFLYPLGRSPVCYIGRTTAGARRLANHQAAAMEAYDELQATRIVEVRRPGLYNYAARFGALVFWVPAAGNRSPDQVAADLIDDFYWVFGAIPVANSQWPWQFRSTGR